MSGWHDVGALADVERRGRLVVRVNGRELGVLHDPQSGALHAVRNRCPHQGAPLCLGVVAARAHGAPGVYELGADTVVRCPWHGWEFELATGRCPEDATMRVATYPVRVEDGRVLVAVG